MAESTDLQKLVVSLEARTAQFEKQLARANAQATRQTKAIERRFQQMNANVAQSTSRIGSSFAAIGRGIGALGIGIGVSTIVGGLREILSAADDLVDTADRLGILPTQLELFRVAAEKGGASAGELDAGLKKLQVNWVTAATKGGAFADFLTSQGVALRDASGEIPDLNRQMEIMADLLSRTTSESQRAAIATLAFGKGAAALGQAFSGTSLEDARRELERFGQATDEQLRKLADAHETIETFWRAFKQNAAIATSKGITAIQNFNAEVTGLGGLINDFLADPNVRTFYDLLFGKGAADAAGLVKQSDAIKDNNDALIAYQDELRKTEAQIAALRAEIARLKEEDPTINVTGIESAIMQLQVRQAELNTLIQETVGLYADLSGMRAQAESYVNWQIRRAQGYTAIPGAPPQPAYSPTALPQVTVPPKKVEADVEIEIDDDDAEKAAKKLTDKFSGNLSDAVTNAIGAWETRGMSAAEAYMAIGGAGEIGRYQIMQANIGPWSREALGYSVTPAAFRASPDIQDQVARFKVQQYMDQYYAKYGIEGVARAWNTGSPTGRATAGYVEGVMGMLESGAGFQDLQEGINDTTDAMAGMIDRMAELRSASEDFLNTFVDGILDGKSAVEALGDALEELGRSLIKSGIHQLVGAIFPTPLGGASLLQHGGPMYPGNVYRVHKDEVVVPRSPMSVIPASKVGGGGGGGYSLNYAPSIVIQGNADEAAIRMMRDRMLIDIEQRLPSMVRGAHRDRRL